MGGDPMISVENCSKIYPRGNVVAFEGLSFEVRRHEIVTIVGPSGCGKTTLLRSINGLVPLTAGVIRIGDTEVTEPDPRIAIVFQHFGLFPWQTVESNVGFGLRMQGVKKSEWHPLARSHIELVGLKGFERSYPYQLSGGMKQRVGLARALAMEPEVLLMDEPFASVDAQTRELLQEQLLQIWQNKPRTMVFITHSIEEALLIGDRVIVLTRQPGRVKETIDVPFERPRAFEQVYADPRFGELRNHIWTQLEQEGAKDALVGAPAADLANLLQPESED